MLQNCIWTCHFDFFWFFVFAFTVTIRGHQYKIYTVSKNDTDVALYNFNAHQPILVIFGRDVAIKRRFVIPPLLTNVTALPGETWTWTPEIVSFQSCCITCLENDTALACYIFDIHQPILIFFVDNTVVLLGTVCKYYFSYSHFVCETGHTAWLKRHNFRGWFTCSGLQAWSLLARWRIYFLV